MKSRGPDGDGIYEIALKISYILNYSTRIINN